MDIETLDQLRADHSTLLYIAGALETYFQFSDQVDHKGAAVTEEDVQQIMELRDAIQPLLAELRTIRHRAAGLGVAPEEHPTST